METSEKTLNDLSWDDALQFIIDCLALVQIQVNKASEMTKLTMQDIFNYHGKLKLYTLHRLFENHAAKNNEAFKRLKPSFRSFFIKELREAHFNTSGREPASAKPKLPSVTSRLNGFEKFKLFCNHAVFYKCLPRNADWVEIYDYMLGEKLLKKIPKYTEMKYSEKWKICEKIVTEWAHRRFNITNALMFAGETQPGNLKLKEAFSKGNH